MTKNLRSLVIVAAVLAASLATAPAFATKEDSNSSSRNGKDVASLTAEDAKKNVEDRKEAIKQRQQAKLDQTKLKVCEKRLTNIKKIMSNIQERATRQIDVFTKISERTQKFYVDKQYSTQNYDSLVAAVNDKKTATESVVADVAAFGADFTCSGDNAGSFKADVKAQLQAQNDALKDYKTAVKNLIVAVKSANSNDKQEAQQ